MLAVLTGRFIGPIQSMLLAVALSFAFALPFSLALMIITRLMLLALLFPLHRRSRSRCRGRSWSRCLRCRSGCNGFRSRRGSLGKRVGKGKQYCRSSHCRNGSNHSILHIWTPDSRESLSLAECLPNHTATLVPIRNMVCSRPFREYLSDSEIGLSRKATALQQNGYTLSRLPHTRF